VSNTAQCRSKTTGEKAEVSGGGGAASDAELEVSQDWSTVDKQSQQPSAADVTQEFEETGRSQDRLRINVSGLVFEVSEAALNDHPTTVLGNPEKRAHYWVERRLEYFFDRHRPSFDAIFAYLVEGCSLKRPPHVPSEVFLEEV